MINHIDTEKCTGCGTCYKTCGLDVFRMETAQNNLSPCMAACPAGIDIRGYNALLQQGETSRAAHLLKEKNPFPSVTGRVCPRLCEQECQRQKVDEAVNINALEQYLGDLSATEEPVPSAVRHVAKVAVVGSGPAGLSCAWFLASAGYPVTVFEALPQPGGMLRYGIPAYRLPDQIVDQEIKRLKALGVRFVCGVKIGSDGDMPLAQLKEQGFKAVCLAPGTTLSRKADIVGEQLPQCLSGVEFLRSIRLGLVQEVKGNVVVVGGGDVAMDAAISAIKLGGASVNLICLEQKDAMPAFAHNVEDALAEGVKIHYGWGPLQVEGKERVTGLTTRQCLSVVDDEGRFAPQYDNSQICHLDADYIIFAIGQAADLHGFQDDVNLAGGRITVDPVTFATSYWNIFAAGDAVRGPSSVVSAIRDGREAALSIIRLLSGAHQHSDREENRTVAENLPGEGVLTAPRLHRSRICPEHPFAEKQQGLDDIDALTESMRCMTCGAKARIAYRDDCMTCFFCELRCPHEAVDVHPFKERLPYTLESNFGGY